MFLFFDFIDTKRNLTCKFKALRSTVPVYANCKHCCMAQGVTNLLNVTTVCPSGWTFLMHWKAGCSNSLAVGRAWQLARRLQVFCSALTKHSVSSAKSPRELTMLESLVLRAIKSAVRSLKITFMNLIEKYVEGLHNNKVFSNWMLIFKRVIFRFASRKKNFVLDVLTFEIQVKLLKINKILIITVIPL